MQCGDLECNSERFTKSGASFATDPLAPVASPNGADNVKSFYKKLLSGAPGAGYRPWFKEAQQQDLAAL
jgi:hypothetical protein